MNRPACNHRDSNVHPRPKDRRRYQDRRSRSSVAILAGAWTLLICALPVSADDGWTTVKKLTAMFVSWSGKPDSKFYRSAAQFIDYQTMAERALGPERWSKLSATQHKEFVAALERLMEERYYVRWHRIFSKGEITCTGSSGSGQDSLVKTNLSIGSKTDSIVWRLESREKKVISLSVGDKDLLQRLSVRLQKKIKSSGFDSLLAWMQKRASASPDSDLSDSQSTASVTGESD